MSYAAPFSLVSLHLPDRDGSADGRLTWPLAGSLALHVVVFGALLLSRFAASLEPSSGSYEVTLVTLPEVSASPTASPELNSRRKSDNVPPPKVEARDVPKSAPPRTAASPPSPLPQEKPRVPEMVTDSLVGALDSVVVPKQQTLTLPPMAVAQPVEADDGKAPQPERITDSLVGALDSVVIPKQQTPALPQKADPVPAPAPPPPPAPTKQAPTVEMDVQPIQAPPQPPKLAPGPVSSRKAETPTPAPMVDLLAKTLKQAVGTIVVPKKPKQVSSRVSPAITSDVKQQREATRPPRSSGITLPAAAPRLADVSTLQVPKKERPLETARNSSTAKEVTKAIQSVRVPDVLRTNKTPQPGSESFKARKRSQIVVPPAPPLAEVHVEQDAIPSEPMVPETSSERPVSQVADVKPGFQQTDSGAQEALPLRVAGSSPQGNAYWARVQAMIDGRWIVSRVAFHDPLQVILAFRVKQNGQVSELVVARSSGNDYFDETAERAVVAAAPLPPFPATMRNPYYDVQYTFTGPRD